MGNPMPPRRYAASIVLAVATYSATFVVRKTFGILTYSGTVDWLMVILFAALPPLVNRSAGALPMAALFVVAFLLEVIATGLIMVLLFTSYL